MGFLSQLTNVFTGSESAKAAKKAGRIQSETAQEAIEGQIIPAGERSIARFEPLAQVAQTGIDLAGFLTDPNQQFDFAQSNPLFNLGVQNLTENVQQSAAGRSRLSAGDTLERLRTVPLEVANPLIDRQRQDILNLLGLSQGVSSQQGQIDLGTARNVTDLLTGGAAARAAGVIGAQNARTAANENTAAKIEEAAKTFFGGGFGGFGG